MRPVDPRVRPHLRPARVALSVVLAGNVVAALLIIAQAFAVASLVAKMLDGGDWGPSVRALIAVTVGRAIIGWVVDVAAARAAGQVGVHLRDVALEAALHLDAATAARRRTGELTALLTRGVAAVEPYLTRYLPALALAAVLPALTVAAIWWQDWLAGLVVVLTLPLVPVFAVLIGMATKDRAERQWRRLTDLAGHFLDVVRGLPTLLAHGRGEAQVGTIRAVTHRYRRASRETLKLAFASSAALELIATISVALVAVVVGLRLAAGGLDLQTALTVLLLAPEAYWPLRRVGAEYHAAAEGTATFEAIHHLAEKGVMQRRVGGSVASNGDFRGPAPVSLDGIRLAWPGRHPVIEELSARIPAVGLTAIAGPSGCGKSTLIQALLGELPLAAGRIRVGGRVIAAPGQLPPAAWQAAVAQVPQRPWLTAGTIAENLRIGRPDAGDDALWEVLAAVDLAAAVRALPDGLETRLGDDGAGLSAGQRARLALARVVLSDRRFVVLDEPTAHLDEETEAVLLATLGRLARDRCVLVVAHRAAVLEAADQVLELPPPGPVPNPTSAARTERPIGRRITPHSAPHKAPLDAAQGPTRRGRWALAVLLGVLASASGVALTATAGWLIARAAEQPPVMLLTLAIVGVRTFGLARPALRYAERLVSHDVALGALAERRARLYAALVPLVPARIGRRGDALTGLVEDVDSLVDHRLRVQLPIWTWAGVSLIAGAVAWWLLPAALPVVLGVCLAGPLALVVAGLGARRAEPRLIATRAELGIEVHDALSAARQLVLWQATPAVLSRLAAHSRRLAAATGVAARAVAGARALVVLAAGGGVAVAAHLAAPAYAAGQVSGPMLAMLLLVPLALTDVLLPLADAGALRARTRAAQDRLAALERTRPAVTDPATPLQIGPVHPRVDLDRVWAGWADEAVLRGLSLELPPGARVGVTGPSGSGKSTLAAVLMRFLEVRDGSYDLGRTDVESLRVRAVRERVGLLDDDPYVLASTVAENVRLARPSATDTDVSDALRAAHLGRWLDGLPAGLATRIGEGGAAVSGGERARIGLARALLADKPVLVLDEPTAHLDTATARAVADDVLAAGTERTLVWISHDRVGLEAMDRVVRLGEPAGVPVRLR